MVDALVNYGIMSSFYRLSYRGLRCSADNMEGNGERSKTEEIVRGKKKKPMHENNVIKSTRHSRSGNLANA